MASAKVRGGKRRFFYGWWLLAAATATNVLQGALYSYGFPVFFLPLAHTLGSSRGALSAAFSFTRLESSFLGPIEGFLIDRFGPRLIMYVGVAIMGLGFILFSMVDSLLSFFIIFPIVALGASMAGFLPTVTAVNNWFSRRRGLVTGIAASGVNIGGLLVAMVAVAIGFYGWRTTALTMGLIVLLFGFPLAAMMRHRPQQYGYLPDGVEPGEARVPTGDGVPSPGAASEGSVNSSVDETPDFTPGQALRTPAFWLIASAHSLSVLIIGAVTIHEIPVLVDAGISYEAAAGVMAFMMIPAWIGRVAGGYIGDRFGMKPTLIACFAMMSAGIVVLAFAQTVPQAMIWAVLYGFGYGARAPILIALRGYYFGARNFATIMGLSQPVMAIGTFVGPMVAGIAYDVQGSYRMVFTIIALVSMIGAVLVLFFEKPALPQRREAATVARE